MVTDKQDNNQGKNFLNVPSKREQSQTNLSSAEREGLRPKGNVPTLRFPEFTDKWKECELQDVASISKGAGISKNQLSDTGEPCILYGELYTKYKSELITDVLSKTNIDTANLVRSKANDVIIPSSGETAIDISTARCVPFNNILLGGDLNLIRLREQDGKFFSYQLNGVRKLDIAQIAQGVSVVHLYGESLKRLIVHYPSKPEQEKISSLLAAIDERITTQIRTIEDLKAEKKYLLEQLFCLPNEYSPKMRLHGYCGNWQKVRLSEIVNRITRRNKENGSNRVLTIAAQYGLIDQQEFFKKQIASSDLSNYYLLHNGDFAYNKSYSGDYPWGAVKRLDKYPDGVLSSLYICFRPTEHVDSDFLCYYFESTKWYRGIMEISGEGARNHGLLNMSVEDFFATLLRIPTIEEQKDISKMLNIFSQKVAIEEQLLNKLQVQKNFLLNEMFV